MDKREMYENLRNGIESEIQKVFGKDFDAPMNYLKEEDVFLIGIISDSKYIEIGIEKANCLNINEIISEFTKKLNTEDYDNYLEYNKNVSRLRTIIKQYELEGDIGLYDSLIVHPEDNWFEPYEFGISSEDDVLEIYEDKQNINIILEGGKIIINKKYKNIEVELTEE